MELWLGNKLTYWFCTIHQSYVRMPFQTHQGRYSGPHTHWPTSLRPAIDQHLLNPPNARRRPPCLAAAHVSPTSFQSSLGTTHAMLSATIVPTVSFAYINRLLDVETVESTCAQEHLLQAFYGRSRTVLCQVWSCRCPTRPDDWWNQVLTVLAPVWVLGL